MPDQASVFLTGSLASLLAGLGTGVGAVPIFLIRKLTPSWEVILISLAAGLMLAAASFSLLLPGLDIATIRSGAWAGAVIMALALMVGGVGFWLVHRWLPHEHFIKGREGGRATFVKRLWLFIIAITLHNLPEGLAVGAGFGAPDPGSGLALAIGIGLQNMPEGLVVAVALVALGYRAGMAFLVATLTGLVEPLGGVIAAGTVAYMDVLLPWVLGIAAGAMLFVVGGEMIPETHRHGHETRATFGLLGGFAIMIVLSAGVG